MHEAYDRGILPLAEPSRVPAAVNPRPGIVGGGQLAPRAAPGGLHFGCDVLVLERSNWSPAASRTARVLAGDGDNPGALLKLAAQVAVVTLKSELVDPSSLIHSGKPQP